MIRKLPIVSIITYVVQLAAFLVIFMFMADTDYLVPCITGAVIFIPVLIAEIAGIILNSGRRTLYADNVLVYIVSLICFAAYVIVWGIETKFVIVLPDSVVSGCLTLLPYVVYIICNTIDASAKLKKNEDRLREPADTQIAGNVRGITFAALGVVVCAWLCIFGVTQYRWYNNPNVTMAEGSDGHKFVTYDKKSIFGLSESALEEVRDAEKKADEMNARK